MVAQNMTKAEILAWLKKENKLQPFDTIEAVGEINDCEIYSFSTKDGKPLYVGLPRFVVAKGNKLEIVFGEKAFEIIDKLSSDKKPKA